MKKERTIETRAFADWLTEWRERGPWQVTAAEVGTILADVAVLSRTIADLRSEIADRDHVIAGLEAQLAEWERGDG